MKNNSNEHFQPQRMTQADAGSDGLVAGALVARKLVARTLLAAGLVAMMAVAAPGCVGVAFEFGRPPALKQPTDRVRRCILRNRITTRPARARWVDQSSPADTQTGRMFTAHGLTFYKGKKRLTAAQMIATLNHPALETLYAKKYWKHERKSKIQRIVGWVLMGTAAAAVTTGTGLLAAGLQPDPKDKTLTYSGLAVGIGGLVAAIPAGYLLRSGWQHQDRARVHRTLFLAADLKDELARALDHYNREVARRCQARFGASLRDTKKAAKKTAKKTNPRKTAQ